MCSSTEENVGILKLKMINCLQKRGNKHKLQNLTSIMCLYLIIMLKEN